MRWNSDKIEKFSLSDHETYEKHTWSCYYSNNIVKIEILAFFSRLFLLQERRQFYTDALNQISIRIRLGPPHSSFKKKNCIWLFIERCQKSVILFKESFWEKKEHLETNNKVQTWFISGNHSLKFECWDFLIDHLLDNYAYSVEGKKYMIYLIFCLIDNNCRMGGHNIFFFLRTYHNTTLQYIDI